VTQQAGAAAESGGRARTLCDLFHDAVAEFAKPRHLLYKKDGTWRAFSSADFRRAVDELSVGLQALGLEPGDRVAILAENRPEWAFADLAALTAAAVDVPIYATLTAPQVFYILKDSQAKVAFVSGAAQAKKIADVRAQVPGLVHVVSMDDPPPAGTLSLAEVRDRGRAVLAGDPAAAGARLRAVRADDVATLIYTSGTTGEPKGVMLTHHNIVSNVEAAIAAFPVFGPGDVALSFLPLCHIFERMAGYYMMLARGVTIAYAEGVEAVPANMLEVRPTVMCCVPRLYEKMHARILEKVAGEPALRRRIFHWGLQVGLRAFRHRLAGTALPARLRMEHALAERLVFAKIKRRMGGRLKLFVSGGAPLGRDIAEFFGAVGLPILEGYGLTETSPVISVNRPREVRPGTVGRPLSTWR